MSATDTFENAILNLVFKGTTFAGIADNAASSPVTQFYISLHTADPGEAGSQNSGETTYVGYARIPVLRDGTAWSVASGEASNIADIDFGQCTASPGSNLTHVGIGTDVSGTGTLYLSAALSSAVIMQIGATPLFSAGQLKITCS